MHACQFHFIYLGGGVRMKGAMKKQLASLQEPEGEPDQSAEEADQSSVDLGARDLPVFTNTGFADSCYCAAFGHTDATQICSDVNFPGQVRMCSRICNRLSEIHLTQLAEV